MKFKQTLVNSFVSLSGAREHLLRNGWVEQSNGQWTGGRWSKDSMPGTFCEIRHPGNKSFAIIETSPAI